MPDHLRHGLILAQECLVTDDDANHLSMILAIDIDQTRDLRLVEIGPSTDPGAQRHIQVMRCGQTRHLAQRAPHGIGAHRMRITGQQGQIGVDIADIRVGGLCRVLIAAHRRKREAFDLGRPRWLNVGPIGHAP